ncbi:hypothetical protein Y032_0011g1248 [Ancylostoma ceylanicum]|uniref:Uncharacterized protein n=1 Tax=Ancylostoma ceylanicum TaxID=53326 RepID=A0A016VFK3_9BILA|nr:hypothetical protein Y032_0011g1248 [Ancylostoma ceylanicum]
MKETAAHRSGDEGWVLLVPVVRRTPGYAAASSMENDRIRIRRWRMGPSWRSGEENDRILVSDGGRSSEENARTRVSAGGRVLRGQAVGETPGPRWRSEESARTQVHR